MEKNQNSDFVCACSMCANYDNCLADEAEQEKLMEEICHDSRTIIFWHLVLSALLGIYLGYTWHYFAIKGQILKKDTQIEQLKMQIVETEARINEIAGSKEYFAIKKCENSGKLKPECIIWELKNAK